MSKDKILSAVTGSAPPPTAPKVNNINTRAAIAGLAIFLPNPPNKHLTIIIANADPIAACHNSTLLLKFNAKIKPVTTALKSFTVCFCFVQTLNKYSETTALATQTKIINNSLIPNKAIAAI